MLDFFLNGSKKRLKRDSNDVKIAIFRVRLSYICLLIALSKKRNLFNFGSILTPHRKILDFAPKDPPIESV